MRPITYLLCSALILCGCGYDSRGTLYPSADPSVTLTVSSTGVMTSAGDTLSVTAVVRNADQTVVPSPALAWSSSALSENLRNSIGIKYVMKNGRLYDATNLNEVYPRQVKGAPFPWNEGDSPTRDRMTTSVAP